MPEKERLGEFIARKLNIPKNELTKIINMQNYLDDKIGEMALREGFINQKDLDEILNFQERYQGCFGNAAICRGLMRNSQIKYLLDLQAQEKSRVGELLVKRKIVSQEKLLEFLAEFYSQHETQFTILAFTRRSLAKDLREAIAPYPYTLQVLEDEEELISLARTIETQLVILDDKLGEMGEFAQKIREQAKAKKLKIALFSETKEKLEMLTGYESGIDYNLPVPFDTKNLVNIIIDTDIQFSKTIKQKILVVDDSDTVRSSIARELKESGFQVVFAENGKEALDLALLERPDLVTMDINMPVMDGYEACLRLKNNSETSRIPVIILTTKDTQEEREKGFEVGATEYFTKPFTKGHLSNYIRHLLSLSKAVRPEKILIADDNAISRNIFANVLTKFGYQYEIVESGEQVLERLNQGYEPSCVLLDCFMPGMDGFQTCHSLKNNENYQKIPVIMVTSAREKESVLKGLKAGAEDYIIKPFDEDELMARVQAHIKFYTLLNKIQNQYDLLKEKGEALEKEKEKAEKANQLKDKFVSLVAHDLRSPFTTILGFLEIMIDDDENPLREEHRELMEMVVGKGKELVDLIQSLLDVGRFRTGKIEPKFEFADGKLLALEAVMGLDHVAKKKKVELVCKALEHTRLYVDTRLIIQVIQNLVTNAIKFSKPGDKITITRPAGESTTIAVKDTGEGIEKDRLDKLFIFEEATSTIGTAGEKGTGLGLPLCREIMEAHGGTITVVSNPGSGSVFFVKFPEVTPRVLIVDDSRLVRKKVTGILNTLGVKLTEAESGAEALELLKKDLPHLIISDIMMPEMDGFELLTRLRKNPRTKSIPVIIITSDKNMETREKVFHLGADDYITKPFAKEDIVPRVKKFIL